MASLTQQILRCCPLLKKISIVNSAKQLRKQAVKTWTLPLQQSGLRFFCPYRYSCQLVLKNSRTVLPDNHVRFCSSSTELNQSPDDNSSLVHRPETEIISSSYTEALHEEGLEETLPPSPFEEVSEDETFQIAAKPPLPFESFSLRDYVDHSETLQKLVLLGVDLSKVEKRTTAGQLLLKLDFEKDIKKFILFLKDVGVEDNQLGPFITKNPYIFKEELEDLKTRVAYLTSKKFSKEAIAQMVSGAPYLLLFSVERLDNRLGFFQRELGLNVQKTRDLVTRLPRLLTESLEPVKENLKVCELELGFSQNEIRHIVHIVPKILRINKWKLIEIFDYVHNIMGIPHSTMVHFPQVFNSRLLRIKERHMFLKFIGRAQYDPKQPNYVSLEKLASLPDDVFCTEIAKVEKQDFQIFLKTL